MPVIAARLIEIFVSEFAFVCALGRFRDLRLARLRAEQIGDLVLQDLVILSPEFKPGRPGLRDRTS